MTREQLDQIEERANSVSLKRWLYIAEQGMSDDERPVVFYQGWGAETDLTEADQEFFRHAPEDILALVEEVHRLRAALDEFGEHRPSCAYGTGAPCDCGFKEVISYG